MTRPAGVMRCSEQYRAVVGVPNGLRLSPIGYSLAILPPLGDVGFGLSADVRCALLTSGLGH